MERGVVETLVNKQDLQTLSDGFKNDLRDLRDVLTEQIRDGFKGVHERQDVTNGRVGKGEVELGRQDTRLTNMERELFRRRRGDRARGDGEDAHRQPTAAEDKALTRRDLYTVVATLGAAGAFWAFVVKVLPAIVKAVTP